MITDLNPEEIQRYARHLVLPEIGLAGQQRLKNSSALIVGCGGLGAPIALYLAAAGLGRIGLVDYDVVEFSNLQRQIIYTTHAVGTSKVLTARKQLEAINPQVQVDTYEELFTSQNAERISAPYQILIDGTDNIPTRYLLNDLGVLNRKPYVYGAVYRFSGQVAVFDASKGACYRCLFPTPPSRESVPSCAVAGVMGVMPGLIGLLQATEVIKLAVGIGEPLTSQLMLYDALECRMNMVHIPKNPACNICGHHPKIRQLIDYEAFCQMSIHDHSLVGEDRHAISPEDLTQRISEDENLMLVDLREPVELEISHIPGSKNVPFHTLAEEMKNWDKGQSVVLICHIGFLSSIACEMMITAGFKDVRHVAGGIRGYARACAPWLQVY